MTEEEAAQRARLAEFMRRRTEEEAPHRARLAKVFSRDMSETEDSCRGWNSHHENILIAMVPTVPLVATNDEGNIVALIWLAEKLRSCDPDYLGDHDIRPTLLRCIGCIGDERAVPVLSAYLRHWDTELAIESAKALGYLGDPDAVYVLVQALTDWLTGPAVVTALRHVGREPASEEEQVWFWLYLNDKESVASNKETVKRVLSTELQKGCLGAMYAVIALGWQDMVPLLLENLSPGDEHKRDIAMIYFASGNWALKNRAIDWGTKQGIQFLENGTGVSGVIYQRWEPNIIRRLGEESHSVIFAMGKEARDLEKWGRWSK